MVLLLLTDGVIMVDVGVVEEKSDVLDGTSEVIGNGLPPI